MCQACSPAMYRDSTVTCLLNNPSMLHHILNSSTTLPTVFKRALLTHPKSCLYDSDVQRDLSPQFMTLPLQLCSNRTLPIVHPTTNVMCHSYQMYFFLPNWVWQSSRGKWWLTHWASLLRWIWSLSEYNLKTRDSQKRTLNSGPCVRERRGSGPAKQKPKHNPCRPVGRNWKVPRDPVAGHLTPSDVTAWCRVTSRLTSTSRRDFFMSPDLTTSLDITRVI